MAEFYVLDWIAFVLLVIGGILVFSKTSAMERLRWERRNQ